MSSSSGRSQDHSADSSRGSAADHGLSPQDSRYVAGEMAQVSFPWCALFRQFKRQVRPAALWHRPTDRATPCGGVWSFTSHLQGQPSQVVVGVPPPRPEMVAAWRITPNLQAVAGFPYPSFLSQAEPNCADPLASAGTQRDC